MSRDAPVTDDLSPELGCIADDLTGATDLANALATSGLRTVLQVGTPLAGEPLPPGTDAVVIALKTRTVPVEEAVRRSLEALEALQGWGAKRTFFKYCSTFDSTPHGNIGPVTEALRRALDASMTIACPAFPATGRTVYFGHLFVHGQLLSESPMRHHPLTPMTDANIVRHLARQTTDAVDLLDRPTVAEGSVAVRRRLDDLARAGARQVVVDAISDEDLENVGKACADLVLATGGSAVAAAIARHVRREASQAAPTARTAGPKTEGACAVIAGSCSAATLEQIRYVQGAWPHRLLEPDALVAGPEALEDTRRWIDAQAREAPLLIHSSVPPEQLRATQERYGRERVGRLVEDALAEVASYLVQTGRRRLVIAGGETSGAVAAALGIHRLTVGPEIAPGVPWMHHAGSPDLYLALKSGNFGQDDFFVRALQPERSAAAAAEPAP